MFNESFVSYLDRIMKYLKAKNLPNGLKLQENKFLFLQNSKTSSSDRFIPRRANVNFDLSYYLLTNSNRNVESEKVFTVERNRFINTARHFYNQEQYRTRLWGAMMPKKQETILVFSSPKKKKKKIGHCPIIESGTTSLWPVRPRPKPLLEPPSVILDMPDLDTNTSHQAVDWGKKGIIATVYEHEVHLWDPNNHVSGHVTNTGRKVQSCLKWNQDGTQLAMALEMGAIAVWDCETAKALESCSCLCRPRSCVITAMEFTSRNLLVTGCSQGRLCLWSPLMVCQKTLHPAHEKGIVAIKFSCRDNYLVTTSVDRRVRLWAWPSLEGLFEFKFSMAPVKAVAWHPWRDPLLVIGGSTDTFLWHAGTLKQVETKTHPHQNSIIDSLTFNPLSAELVASYYVYGEKSDYHLLTVQKDLENIIDEVLFHEGRVPYLLWDATGTKLATASADENLCIWDFFGSSTDLEKSYLKSAKKKELSTDIFEKLNSFGSCIR